MAIPESTPISARDFNERLGQTVRRDFGPATAGNWRHIAGSIFPSLLNDGVAPRLPRALQSYFNATPHEDPDVYHRFVENFETWDTVLRIMQVPLEERAELFDPVLQAIIDMKIVPEFRSKVNDDSVANLPDRELRITATDLPIRAFYDGLVPVVNRFEMDPETPLKPSGLITCTFVVSVHS